VRVRDIGCLHVLRADADTDETGAHPAAYLKRCLRSVEGVLKGLLSGTSDASLRVSSQSLEVLFDTALRSRGVQHYKQHRIPLRRLEKFEMRPDWGAKQIKDIQRTIPAKT
jgi:hypothetical protein